MAQRYDDPGCWRGRCKSVSECEICHALVNAEASDLHRDWHYDINRAIHAASEGRYEALS